MRRGGGHVRRERERERCYCSSAFHSLRNQASVFRYVNILLSTDIKTKQQRSVKWIYLTRVDLTRHRRAERERGEGRGGERAKRKERKYVYSLWAKPAYRFASKRCCADDILTVVLCPKLQAMKQLIILWSASST